MSQSQKKTLIQIGAKVVARGRAPSLEPRMPPPRGGRLLFRAEPALASAFMHVDAIVITIAGHVVDALALAADVAFDEALSGRFCRRACEFWPARW